MSPSVRFREQVAPILVQRCLACHGPKRASAHFRVDTFARLMADSDAGKTIEPGKPDESLFLDLIVLTEPTGRMPKNADPLPKAEIDLLRRWIEQGAKSGGLDPGRRACRRGRAGQPADRAGRLPDAPCRSRRSRSGPTALELAIGGYHEVTIWDPSSGKLLRRIPGLPQRTQGLAYSADGSWLAVAGGTPGESGELVLVDPSGARLSRGGSPRRPTSCWPWRSARMARWSRLRAPTGPFASMRSPRVRSFARSSSSPTG